MSKQEKASIGVLSATSNDLGWYLSLQDNDGAFQVLCIHSGKQQIYQFEKGQEQKAQHLYNALACLSGFTEEPYERN